MAKILGLDLGTNSIGWALIDREKITSTNEKGTGIIACGCRIFKEGVNKNSSGKEVSRNTTRRIARGARRKNYRFKMRRKRLIKELKKLEMLPDNRYYTFKKHDKKNHTIELFKLRKKALDEKIRLEDIGRIFLQINNHRGFKSNKKEDAVTNIDKDKEKELLGVKGTIQKLEKRIKECNCRTIGEYYYFLIEQNKNSHNPNEPKLLHENDFLRGEGAYTSRELFEKEFDAIWEKQKEYYQDILTDENKEIIKDECIFYQRDLRSAKHLRNRCKLESKGFWWDKKNKKHINYLPCCTKSSFEFQEYRIWEQLNKLRYTNFEFTHQALSLEQKHELAEKLHDNEKLTLTQIKNILNLSRDTKFNDIGDHLKGNITQARLIKVFGKDFWSNSIVKQETEGNNSKFKPNEYSNIQRQLWHNIQFSKDKNWLLGKDEFIENVHRKNRKQALKKNAFYTPHNQWKQNLKQLELSDEQISKYAETTFEPGYSDYSTKAIRKLLYYMKQGDDLVTSSYKVYGDYTSSIQKEGMKLEYKVPQLANNSLRNPIVEKSVRETIKIINTIIEKYGKPDRIHLEMARELKMPKEARENIYKRNSDKDKVREEYARFLSKKLKRNIDKTSPDIKIFEMFLELNYSQKGFNNNIKGKITDNEIEKFLRLKIPSNKTKYYLWLECDRKDPYEGNTISLSTLFSNEIEIEHIIPYSLCGDNSFMNKTLSFKTFNAKKGNKTPMQYFEDKPLEKELFKQNIKKFSDGKKERFLMTDNQIEQFRNSQLNNTAYIATEVRKHLLETFKNENIELTNGVMTSLVRTLLGFNGILNKPVKVDDIYWNMGKVWAILNESKQIVDFIERTDDAILEYLNVMKGVINSAIFYPSKIRDDHRHHIVDALITALLNKKINNSILKSAEGTVNQETGEFKSKFYTNEKGEHKLTKETISEIREKLKVELNLIEVDELFPYATKKIENIFISYQNERLETLPRKKLFTPNGKQLKDKNGQQLRSSGLSVRHELHESNFYGKTKNCKENEFVRRVKLEDLTFNQLTSIVDKKIQEIIIGKIIDFTLETLNDSENPVRIDELLKTRGKIKEIILLSIAEKEIKEQLNEIKGLKGKEVRLEKQILKSKENEIKTKLPEKEDYKKIKQAIEKGLRKALKEGIYLENKGKRQLKKGNFNPEIVRNDIPIKKVRVKFFSNTAIPVKRKRISAQLASNSVKEIEEKNFQYVMPGNNYLFVIYGEEVPDKNGINRDRHIVSWFDKAQVDIENAKISKQNKIRANKGGKQIPLHSYFPSSKNGLDFLCALSHNDMVIIFNDDEGLNDINWNNQEELFNRLFTVNDFDQRGKIIFTRHNKSLNVPATKAEPVGENVLLGEGEVLRRRANTFRGIKVEITPIGTIN